MTFDVRCLMFDSWRAVLIAALAGSSLVGSAVAADSPSVTAVLSDSSVEVGETVQLQIRVKGSSAKPPADISVDGLEIHQTGTEQHVEMNNFNFSQSMIYNYTIVPMKAGKFRIPPQTVQVGGSALKTQELTLNVADGAGGSARSNPNAPQSSAVDQKRIGFIELIVPKREAYVGEIVPVVVKLCLNARVRFQQVEPPEFNAQGLTMQRLEKSGRDMETIEGATYDVTTFKTAIAAARTGKFEIPGLQSKAVALLQKRSSSSRTQRSRSPFDMFNLDPFNDPLFGDLGMVEPRQLTLKSDPATLEVKPLPPNAPPNFSGAVGTFTMSSDAKPKNAQVGDPITVTSTIAGRGNFDRVSAPVIEDERGWHKYPPSAKFEKDDDVGISGTKTFEMVLSPNERKQAVPPLAFAYFDPAKQQYVTLRTEPIPVKVEGNALPSVAPSGAPTNAQATPPPAARPSDKPQDILYQLTDLGRSRSFTPLYLRPVFWLAQLLPLLALLGFMAWKTRQARAGNREAQRTAALQREAADLMRKLRRNDSPTQEYLSQASRAVQIKTALARNLDPNAVDQEIAAKTFSLDEMDKAQLRKLFSRSDEIRYSGEHNGAGTITPEDRKTILQLIEHLRV